MALTDNIVLYLKCDESSGTNANDEVGTNDGTLSTATFVTGKINNGIDVTGAAGSYVTMTTLLGTVWDNPYTLAFWVNFGTLDTSNGNILVWPGDRNQQHIVNASNKLEITTFDGSVSNVIGNTSLSTGTWYHVVYQRTSSTAGKVFLNGSDDTSGTATMKAAPLDPGHAFRLGSRQDFTAGNSDAIIDEIGIWSRALSGAEISQLYNAGAGKQYPFSTAYTITAALGTFTLTGIAAVTRSARKIAAAVGTFTLTGIAATLRKGYRIVAAQGTYALTGIAAAISSTRRLAAAVGSFTLTGIAVTFRQALKVLASVGSFVLTGISANLNFSGWTNRPKTTSSWNDRDKAASVWDDRSKSSSTWTNR